MIRFAGPLLLTLLLCPALAFAADKPNVLWITSEDNGPHLGAYGDRYAKTPNLDALAKKGMTYTNCWSTAPVCAPARTVLITGMWAPSLGAQHMRSQVPLPDHIKAYPHYLRKAGYYTTNNSKTDYNVAVDMNGAWDESSRKAHWKQRKDGQPFFAIFNHTISHESKIRNKIDDKDRIHDPAKAPIPAYHPDVPEVRKDWAQYYDRLTMMDALAGKNLKELEDAGLDDDTIVFYYGDHGSGMPRSKRWPYNSGLNVPLIIYVPDKYKHLRPKGYKPGGKSDQLVGFIDLAPTLLSTCGVEPPRHMQGSAIMGRYARQPVDMQFGFRGRMDERYDMVRVCRDKRYIYIRHYMPHKVYGQFINYMFQTPTTRVWKELHDAGKLTPAQSLFWSTKPHEELYDLQKDPDEVNNLATSSDHQAVLKSMRARLDLQLRTWRDMGFLPERQIHTRSGDDAPFTMGQDAKRFGFDAIKAMADRAASLDPNATSRLVEGLGHADSAARYWAALGLLMRGESAVTAGRDALHRALKDDAPSVRVIAAEALGRYGKDADVKAALDLLLDHADVSKYDVFVSMLALNALDFMDQRAAPAKDRIAKLPQKGNFYPRVGAGYIRNLLSKTVSDLK